MAKTSLFARWHNGAIKPVIAENQNPGRVIFVSSVIGQDAAGYGGNPESPYATLGQAHTTATTGAGDKIILMPGHAETYALAASLTITKADLTILGIGNGALIPTFTLDGAGAVPTLDINFNAANVVVQHVKFLNTEDACAAPMDINAGNISFIDCTFEDDGADNTIDWFTLDAAADHLLIQDCKHWGTDTAGNDSFLTLTAGPDHLRIINLHSHGQFAVANLDLGVAAATDARITGCFLENTKATPVVNILCNAGQTGWISDNFMYYVDDATATWINTAGAYACFQNFGVNNAGETGLGVLAGGVSA